MKVYSKWSIKDDNGYWAYVVDQSDGVSCSWGKSDNTDGNYLELFAIYSALKIISSNCIICSNNEFIINGVQTHCKNWHDNNWQSKNFKQIKYKELWETLYNNKYTMEFDKDIINNKYTEMANIIVEELTGIV